jgi:hypothetical protein
MASAQTSTAKSGRAAAPPQGGRVEKKERKEKKFSRNTKFVDGKGTKLDVRVFQRTSGEYHVGAVLQKAGGKREEGCVERFTDKEKAVEKYEELVSVAEKNGWVVKSVSSRSAFDEIPVAEQPVTVQ